MKSLIFGFLFVVNAYGYADMSNIQARSTELNMTINDYAFSMAIAGTLTGSIFGLFLWKAK